ncbi:MAG TPA: hypothetical protein VJQ83_07940 [Tepidiformaceae bacterium]|nr:hypothetical protein [Tepidiformaceae bacterium]
MTIKATSLLALIAIWTGTIVAVVISPGASWLIIFSVLASGAVGVSLWRRLGIPRVIAVAAVWASIAVMVGFHTDAAWASIFAFVSTGAIVYSGMRRDAYVAALGIAAAWGITAAVGAAHDDAGATWICIFAFLTTGAVANSFGVTRGLSAILWWGIAGAIILATGGDYAWLAIFAFVLTASSIGFGGGFSFPRRFEWDLFDRDDDSRVLH